MNNVKFGFVAGSGVILTPQQFSTITLASYGSNKTYMIAGKRSDVLKVLERSFDTTIVCAPPPLGSRHDQKLIAVHINSAKSMSFSVKPFCLYREMMVTLSVYNDQQDLDISLCCLPSTVTTVKIIPSGTTLNQLSDILKERRYMVKRRIRYTATSKSDGVTRVSICHQPPPTYQAAVSMSRSNDEESPPPHYGAFHETLPSYCR
ncbi:hypothetical protein K450DRAFT_242954 [Umbelopsis ramanniana AG]|uniref:Uncharacterized protein n=1 Tax=Umbelopsis ramanniana AG TaxID=1314678 RepID=A0AAD5E9I1_UMBRA|nr:uncharacterized protein K450DRAFT_242954 [Umbelopsis ramanniana AG]KAI8579139.1 hypothetical protein K450DRAFT_242954 [Umbelopsis ramanniana AG]